MDELASPPPAAPPTEALLAAAAEAAASPSRKNPLLSSLKPKHPPQRPFLMIIAPPSREPLGDQSIESSYCL